MKLLDKKRIKAKKGEYLAVNERNMLAKVYTCTIHVMMYMYMYMYMYNYTVFLLG